MAEGLQIALRGQLNVHSGLSVQNIALFGGEAYFVRVMKVVDERIPIWSFVISMRFIIRDDRNMHEKTILSA